MLLEAVLASVIGILPCFVLFLALDDDRVTSEGAQRQNRENLSALFNRRPRVVGREDAGVRGGLTTTARAEHTGPAGTGISTLAAARRRARAEPRMACGQAVPTVQAMPVASRVASGDRMLAQLNSLASLHQSGVLSAIEFTAAKGRLLGLDAASRAGAASSSRRPASRFVYGDGGIVPDNVGALGHEVICDGMPIDGPDGGDDGGGGGDGGDSGGGGGGGGDGGGNAVLAAEGEEEFAMAVAMAAARASIHADREAGRKLTSIFICKGDTVVRSQCSEIRPATSVFPVSLGLAGARRRSAPVPVAGDRMG